MTNTFDEQPNSPQPGGSEEPFAPTTSTAAEGIPFVITREMKADLAARGFTPEQIHNMTPGQAHASLEDALEPGTSKPTALMPWFKGIPDELKAIPNWLLWKYEPPKKPDGKWRKVPYQPNGYKADTTKRHTWRAFETCFAVYGQGGYDGIGFVFDGAVGPDGYCLVGTDLDHCIDDKRVQPHARKWIARLDTYTELSPSGTGFHLIARAKPSDRIVKFGGVEIYCRGRYFTFTGRSLNQGQEIRAAPAEVDALIAEVRAREAAEKQNKPTTKTPAGIPVGAKVAEAFAHLGPDKSLGQGTEKTYWYDRLSPEQKDEVVDHALEVIARNTTFLELEDVPKRIGDNYQWYRLTTAVARSGAPNAEDIFVEHASAANEPDPDDALRKHFTRCQKDPPPNCRGITVGTLLGLALEHGADFEKWRDLEQEPQPLDPLPAWDPAALNVSFANIPHRQWIYGTYLIRGEVTVVASPGGVGKTALTIGAAIEIATGAELLGEKIWGDSLKVLSINREDSKTEVERRVWAFSLAHQLGDRPPDRLYVIGADDPRVKRMSFLQINKKSTPTLNNDGFAALAAALDGTRPETTRQWPWYCRS
jgi:AAA domain